MKNYHKHRIIGVVLAAVLCVTPVFATSCGLIFRKGGDEAETSAESAYVSETATESTEPPVERTPREIYNDAVVKTRNASAYDMEDTVAVSINSEADGENTYTSESRVKYIAEAEDGLPLFSSTTTSVSEAGSDAIMYAFGGGVGYHSIAGVSVKSECTYTEFTEFRDIGSDSVPEYDITDYENFDAETAEDGSVTVTFSEPADEVLGFFYGLMGFTELEIEGSSEEKSDGELKISPEGYIVSERITFTSEITVYGEEYSVEFFATSKVLSVDDPGDVAISLPANTSAYTEIDSLLGFSLVNYFTDDTLASGQASNKYEVSVGSNSFTFEEENEYFSSFNEYGVYTGEAVYLQSMDGGAAAEYRYQYDGSTFMMSDGVDTYGDYYNENEAYHQLSAAVHFLTLTPEQFGEISTEEHDDCYVVTCGYSEEYADYCAIYFLQYLMYDESSTEDYYYIIDSESKLINEAFVRMTFDEDGTLVGYKMSFDGVYTDADGMETAVKATVRVSDMKWYE